MDPSPYFGLQLNAQNPNPIGYLSTYVQSGGAISVLPNTEFRSGSNVQLYIN